MLDIEVHFTNKFIGHGINMLMAEIQKSTMYCDARMIITDTASPININDMKTKPLCGIVFFCHRQGHENMISLINFPFPVYYIDISSSCDFISAKLRSITSDIFQRRCCFSPSLAPQVKTISSKELDIVLRYYSCGNKENIAAQKKLTIKSVLNYKKQAMNALMLDMSTESIMFIAFFKSLMVIISTYNEILEEKVFSFKCPVANYARISPVLSI